MQPIVLTYDHTVYRFFAALSIALLIVSSLSELIFTEMPMTGGLAHSKTLTDWIKERIHFLAPVFVYPGEDEMEALAEGGLRVLRKEEEIKTYGKGS